MLASTAARFAVCWAAFLLVSGFQPVSAETPQDRSERGFLTPDGGLGGFISVLETERIASKHRVEIAAGDEVEAQRIQRREQVGPPLPTFTSTLVHMVMRSRVLQLNFLLVASLMMFVIAFELTHLEFSGVDFNSRFLQYERREAEHKRGHHGALICARDLWEGYVREHGLKFFATVTLVFTMIAIIQYIQYLLVGWTNDFWAKVQKWGEGEHKEGDVDIFYALLTVFLLYTISHVLADSYLDYMLAMFQVHVWGSLTQKFSSRWLGGFAFYRMELDHTTDNPDQRIAEDTRNFVNGSSDLVTGFVSSAAQCIIFSLQVWQMSPDKVPILGLRIPGWLMYAALFYAAAVTALIHLLSWRMKVLDATQQGVEADMRFELMSVRHFADTIAMNRSERVHGLRILDAFETVRRCTWENMFISKRYSLVTKFFNQTEVLWTFIFLGPSFLAGDISLGQLMAAHRAFEFLRSAAMWFADSYGVIQQWRASTERLMRFDESVLRHKQTQSLVVQEDADALSLQKLSITLPKPPIDVTELDDRIDKRDAVKDEADLGERTLLSNLSYQAAPGLRLLLRGPSGSGKSTLLRAISGAWPNAVGTVEIPSKLQEALFFPERVCVLPGTLKAAVCYPVPPTQVGDEEVHEALKLVGLEDLASRGLDVDRQWALALSAGQKARINLARLVLHKPPFSALDEPTAHLEASARVPTLQAVLGALPKESSIIVVSHDESEDMWRLFSSHLTCDAASQTLKEL
mmetsp:Transcript_69143/g.129021  ORF Transcript_69143/g.129021 Transcript_69143/m.129021 type:complete len:747 (+) Transcript_69143:121-2361(+)